MPILILKTAAAAPIQDKAPAIDIDAINGYAKNCYIAELVNRGLISADSGVGHEAFMARYNAEEDIVVVRKKPVAAEMVDYLPDFPAMAFWRDESTGGSLYLVGAWRDISNYRAHGSFETEGNVRPPPYVLYDFLNRVTNKRASPFSTGEKLVLEMMWYFGTSDCADVSEASLGEMRRKYSDKDADITLPTPTPGNLENTVAAYNNRKKKEGRDITLERKGVSLEKFVKGHQSRNDGISRLQEILRSRVDRKTIRSLEQTIDAVTTGHAPVLEGDDLVLRHAKEVRDKYEETHNAEGQSFSRIRNAVFTRAVHGQTIVVSAIRAGDTPKYFVGNGLTMFTYETFQKKGMEVIDGRTVDPQDLVPREDRAYVDKEGRDLFEVIDRSVYYVDNAHRFCQRNVVTSFIITAPGYSAGTYDYRGINAYSIEFDEGSFFSRIYRDKTKPQMYFVDIMGDKEFTNTWNRMPLCYTPLEGETPGDAEYDAYMKNVKRWCMRPVVLSQAEIDRFFQEEPRGMMIASRPNSLNLVKIVQKQYSFGASTYFIQRRNATPWFYKVLESILTKGETRNPPPSMFWPMNRSSFTGSVVYPVPRDAHIRTVAVSDVDSVHHSLPYYVASNATGSSLKRAFVVNEYFHSHTDTTDGSVFRESDVSSPDAVQYAMTMYVSTFIALNPVNASVILELFSTKWLPHIDRRVGLGFKASEQVIETGASREPRVDVLSAIKEEARSIDEIKEVATVMRRQYSKAVRPFVP